MDMNLVQNETEIDRSIDDTPNHHANEVQERGPTTQRLMKDVIENATASEVFLAIYVVAYHTVKSILLLTNFPTESKFLMVTFLIHLVDVCILFTRSKLEPTNSRFHCKHIR